jgi:tetratricopeptide (TPR) repeat protein
MPEPQEPREYDAVLGGKNPPLPDSAVLGGIEGVKRRLASKVVEVKIAALRDALNYGDAGLDLVIEGLQDGSTLVNDAAARLLRTRKESKAKLRLLTYQIKIQNRYYRAFSYNERGLLRYKLGDLEGALADFNEAIDINYNVAYFLYNRGICRQQLGDIQEAFNRRLKPRLHKQNPPARVKLIIEIFGSKTPPSVGVLVIHWGKNPIQLPLPHSLTPSLSHSLFHGGGICLCSSEFYSPD